MMNPTLNTIRVLMRSTGLNQSLLGSKVGMSGNAFGKILSGDSQLRVETLMGVIKAFDLTKVQFFQFETHLESLCPIGTMGSTLDKVTIHRLSMESFNKLVEFTRLS